MPLVMSGPIWEVEAQDVGATGKTPAWTRG